MTQKSELKPYSATSLLRAITRAQSQFITDVEPNVLFDKLLESLLVLTESEYGFIGEVFHKTDGTPYLKTHAITNIAWNEETRKFYEENARQGLEFDNMKTLLGAVIMQTLTVMLQMRGVVTEHTLILKAVVALTVCFVQTPVFTGFFGRLFRLRGGSP